MATWQPPATAPRPLRVGALRGLRVAAGLAALLLVGGLVLRGSMGLTRAQPERIVRTDPVTGAIETDGRIGLATDASRPLFDHVSLAPGDTVQACVRVDYRGDVDPDAVVLHLAGLGGSRPLADRLDVAVERGAIATPATGCDGFVAEELVATGPLGSLADHARDAATGWRGWDPTPGEASTWYRVAVTLDDHTETSLQGARAETGFVWSAVAPPASSGLLHRVVVVLGAVARDTFLPMLLLLAVTMLFLGIQDRIDRRDPKLALAPVTTEPLEFAGVPGARVRATPRRAGPARTLVATPRGERSWLA